MQGESGSPSHAELVADLKKVREKGLSHLRDYATPALTVACHLYGAASDDSSRPVVVEALLREAVEKVGGGREGEAASYTFGLVQGTRMWSATQRRKEAARTQGVSVERFRKGYEGLLIEQVAEGILALLYDYNQQRVADQPEPAVSVRDATDVKIDHVRYSLGRAVASQLPVENSLALKLRDAGVVDFHLSRSDYTTTLAQFLDGAQSSIMMVSMSLKTKGAENEITQVFRRALTKSPEFRIIISLVKPDSPACQAACVILGMPYETFRREVDSMLADLGEFRDQLPVDQASRFYITQHTVIPSFSGILLDDGLPSAQLQTETKPYGAPRSDSYGFTLTAGGVFYERQRLAYYRIVRDAVAYPIDGDRPILPADL
jgi:hypothetical protein